MTAKAKDEKPTTAGKLTQIRPGVWKARVYVGKIDGREVVRSRTFEAKGILAAERAAERIRTEIRAERTATKKRSLYLNGLIDEWLEIKQSKGSITTLYREAPIVKRIRERLGDIRLDQLTPRDIERFYAWLRTTKQPTGRNGKMKVSLTESTVHHHHRVLSAILVTGERWDRLPIATTRKVEKPTKGKSTVRPPTPDEIKTVMERSETMWATLFGFAARTGIRRGEIAAARWVDLTDGGLWVRTSIASAGGVMVTKPTKTDEARLVELDEGTIALLKAWRRELEAQAPYGKLAAKAYIFPDLNADPTNRGLVHLKPDAISKAWVHACMVDGEDEDGRPIKVREVSARFHDLRHFAVSYLLRAGVDVKRVSEQVGHAQTSTTLNIYGHTVGTSGIAAAMSTALDVKSKEITPPVDGG